MRTLTRREAVRTLRAALSAVGAEPYGQALSAVLGAAPLDVAAFWARDRRAVEDYVHAAERRIEQGRDALTPDALVRVRDIAARTAPHALRIAAAPGATE